MFNDFELKVFIDEEKYPNAKVPEKAHDTDAGFDICTPIKFDVMPGMSTVVDTGIIYDIPKGYCMLVVEKSGLAVKNDIHIGAKLLDSDYRDTVKIHILNMGRRKQFFAVGNKIAQMIILPVWNGKAKQVKKLEDLNIKTKRGKGGFGSTGE